MSTTTTSRPKSTSRISAASREAARARQVELMAQLDEFRGKVSDDALVTARIAIWAEHYSANNAALIVMQAPNASEIRGFREWQANGRQVRKGEHGIRILAPAGQAEDTENDKGEKTEGRRFFRLISVFDVAQTDPIPSGGGEGTSLA